MLGDRERCPDSRVCAAPAHRKRSVGACARHRVSRPTSWSLQTPSATPITHGQLPGLSARRGDLLAGGRRLRRRLQLARRGRGGAARDHRVPGGGDARGRARGRGTRGHAGTSRGVLPGQRDDGGRARRGHSPRRRPPPDVLSYDARHRPNREESPMRRMRQALSLIIGTLVLLAMHAGAAHAQKKTLVVALNQDPDILDPTLARTYVGRIIFAQMCEKLYEIDENLRIHPQLAAGMPAYSDGGRTVIIKLRSGVKFNDGTPMTAEAVRFSLDRHQNMKGSNRRSELDSVSAVEPVDPLTVRIRLKAPFAPLVAIPADRAGMPVSPAQAKQLD